MVTQGMTKNQWDKYKRVNTIIIKLRFCTTGPSLRQEEPYQTAIPDKANAVNEIGQKLGDSTRRMLKIKSIIEIIGNAYCKMKK